MSGNSQSSGYLEKTNAEIRSWFLMYDATFKDIARSDRLDISDVIRYYNIPSYIIAPHRDLVMLSGEAVTGYGGVGAELDQLRRDGFVTSDITNLTIKVINDRGAIVEASWERFYSEGKPEISGAVYVISRCDTTWRITAVLKCSI